MFRPSLRILLLSIALGPACGTPEQVPLAPDEPRDGVLPTAPDASFDAGVVQGDAAPHVTTDSAWCKAQRVLQARCVACHDGAGSAGTPMGLTSHDELLAPSPSNAGQSVFAEVAARIHDARRPMPPRGLLAADELALLDDWIARAPSTAEDTRCEPAPEQPPADDTWPSDCDAVYALRAHAEGNPETPVTIAAGSEPHPQVYLDAPWGDEQVQAIGFRHLTDNRKVLHHWILYANADDAFLTGWAPGAEQNPGLPRDVGMFMPRGARSMRLDMHYFNKTGAQDELDRSGVEVCVRKAGNFRPKMASVWVYFSSYGALGVMAPANKRTHTITGKCKVTTREPVHLINALPHAHARAISTKFVVQKRDGSTITMLDRPFLFEEQHAYPLAPEVILETGDVVSTSCTYDNPTGRDLTWGESSENEMCYNFATYYPMGALDCELDLIDRVFGS